MHGGHHGELALATHRVHQVEHLLLVADVQGARRLVEQQHARFLRERTAQHHPLQLAAGERGGQPRGQVVQAQPVDDAIHGGAVAGGVVTEPRDVRGTAQADELAHRHPLGDHGTLRHERHHPGHGASLPLLRVDPGHVHRAARRDQAGQGVEERGLAGAVGADERDPLAGRHREVDPVQDRDPVAGHAEVAAGHGGGGGHRCPLLLLRTRRKNGAPIAAVTTPIGSSAGDIAVRATTSVRTRNAAPTSSDSGSSRR